MKIINILIATERTNEFIIVVDYSWVFHWLQVQPDAKNFLLGDEKKKQKYIYKNMGTNIYNVDANKFIIVKITSD